MTFTAKSQTHDQEIPAAYQAQSPLRSNQPPPGHNVAPEKIVVDEPLAKKAPVGLMSRVEAMARRVRDEAEARAGQGSQTRQR